MWRQWKRSITMSIIIIFAAACQVCITWPYCTCPLIYNKLAFIYIQVDIWRCVLLSSTLLHFCWGLFLVTSYSLHAHQSARWMSAMFILFVMCLKTQPRTQGRGAEIIGPSHSWCVLLLPRMINGENLWSYCVALFCCSFEIQIILNLGSPCQFVILLKQW